MKIQLINFGKQYDKKMLYENQNVNILLKDAICLVGESGVGKTTLCNIILGFEKKYNGECIIDNDGEDIKFSIMPQSNKLLDYATVYENILAFSEESTICGIENLLEELKILDLKDSFVSNISGGQKQRVNLARALINNPNLIVLDEPTGNLDDDTTNNILLLLSEYTKKGIKFLIITHDNRVTTFFKDIVTIENNKIISTSVFDNVKCDKSKQEKIDLKPNIFYKISKNRNKKHFFMNTAIVALTLTCAMLISFFLFSENNQFIAKINGMFNTRAGTIYYTHAINHDDGECDKVMQYTFCGDGEPPIPWYEGFTKEEEDYLKNYEGMESVFFVTNDNDAITYKNTSLDISDLRYNMDNYMTSTGDEIFSDDSYQLQTSLLFAQPSILENMGTFMMQNSFFTPIAGEVHDLGQDEIVIPESYAKVLSYMQDVEVEDLVGQEITFKSYDEKCISDAVTDNCEVPDEINYKIAWIYPAESGEDLLYLPPMGDPTNQKLDLNYSTGNQMFFMSGIDDFLQMVLDSLTQQIVTESENSNITPEYQEIYQEYLIADSSIENKKKALQTGDTEIYYLLKDGYSQSDFMDYLQKGPDPLKYRQIQNPYILLHNKSYNDNYRRMMIVISTTLITSIVVLILQNIYLKIIINELRLARLMGYTKVAVNKILVKHLTTSLIIEIVTASIVSGIFLTIINLFVRTIMINIYNVLTVAIILAIIGLVFFIFHYIVVLKIDVKKELHD